MNAENAVALAVAGLLMVYLVVSLVFPERF
jgi:K+-transporting ATPase KdpF subunit